MIEATIDVGEEMAAGGSGRLTLDPFSFLPGVASRVVGLGGNAPGHDPSYVFHTHYVKVAPGPVTVSIRFDGLVAKRGTLVLRIHVLPAEDGAQARLVNSERIMLNRLLTQDGEVSIQFEAYRDMTYAVMGQIPDVTDARAERLTVALACREERQAGRSAFVEARSTTFGSDRLKPSTQLISIERATLAHPVSQMCTTAQFDEPAYRDWLRRLDQPMRRDRRQWEQVYILQVLKLYGMLETDARGLGLGVDGGALPAAMAAAGVIVTVAAAGRLADEVDGEDAAAQDLHRPGLCDAATFARRVGVRPIDLGDIPHDLVNFDFAWSSSVPSKLGSVADGLRFVDQAMECLRPNGIAVHLFDFDLDMIEQRAAVSDGGLWRRRDMEQAALGLISRGHEVAEIKLPPPDPRGRRGDAVSAPRGTHVDTVAGHAITSFGLIARKAAAPL